MAGFSLLRVAIFQAEVGHRKADCGNRLIAAKTKHSFEILYYVDFRSLKNLPVDSVC